VANLLLFSSKGKTVYLNSGRKFEKLDNVLFTAAPGGANGNHDFVFKN
jgi:hypothetical protein